jgi:hypothetical protein
MSGIIDTVYHLRLLLQKADGPDGLSMSEVCDLEALEAALRSATAGRRYARLDLRISALLKRPGNGSLVKVLDFGPGGMRIAGCGELHRGEHIEMHLREGSEVSYRFPARVSWMRSDGAEITAGVQFVGHPIKMRHGPPSEDAPASIVDRIRVA